MVMVDVTPGVAGLMQSLPKPGEEWHLEDRRKWLEAMDAVLAMTYPMPTQETGVRCSCKDFPGADEFCTAHTVEKKNV